MYLKLRKKDRKNLQSRYRSMHALARFPDQNGQVPQNLALPCKTLSHKVFPIILSTQFNIYTTTLLYMHSTVLVVIINILYKFSIPKFSVL